MQEESILGLLLRVLEKIAAQRHGEEFIHHNVSAMKCYETAGDNVKSAIHNVVIAQMYVSNAEARKAVEKELAAKAAKESE